MTEHQNELDRTNMVKEGTKKSFRYDSFNRIFEKFISRETKQFTLTL